MDQSSRFFVTSDRVHRSFTKTAEVTAAKMYAVIRRPTLSLHTI